MTPRQHLLARGSLVLLWWGTVAASLHDGGAAGIALLRNATGMSAGPALGLVLLGCIWDAVTGLWLLLRPGALACRVAAAGVVGMTGLASLLVPALWLDPFGALLKNLPVLVLLALLAREARPE
ncbi:DoxX-like family protein [Roseateles saccharophilus]|uniref:DoxX-like protein n=1 Tax=Roseateles saccharophilus TaxID=304 RepID=A0A4R3V4G3_ROSSA|nr:DoxX-like family protein [Roseateles saccharophilus]MDG0831486.1 epimerase [Roseateles saccharophilus]TCU98630.1 DoxX-like protein [Roseateles saccharophilus]